MTEVTTGGQQSTDQANEAMTLSEAVRIVRKAIAAEEDRLKQIVNDDEGVPISLAGATAGGYLARVMVEHSNEIAQIMLDYHYPIYAILEEKVPQKMWDELARMVELAEVCSVDIEP